MIPLGVKLLLALAALTSVTLAQEDDLQFNSQKNHPRQRHQQHSHPHGEERSDHVSAYSSMIHHQEPTPMAGGLTVQEPPKGWPFSDPNLRNLAPRQPATHGNIKKRANVLGTFHHESEGGGDGPVGDDFSPVSFVHAELEKNEQARHAKGMPQQMLMSHSEKHPTYLGPRQPRLETTTPHLHTHTQTQVHHDSQKVVSTQNFQLFHGGNSQSQNFETQQMKPMEVFSGEHHQPSPIAHKLKKKKQKSQAQSPATVNVGYTIGFLQQPGMNLQEASNVNVPSSDGLITASGDDILTQDDDEIIIGTPAAKWKNNKGKKRLNHGATGHAESSENHHVVQMIQGPGQQQNFSPQIPTVHHVLHNQPLTNQQISEIISTSFQNNKLYSNNGQVQGVDYQIETVHDQSQGANTQNNQGEHVMLVAAQETPQSNTILYQPESNYKWRNVNGVEVASSIPVTEDQSDDTPNPNTIRPQAQALRRPPQQSQDNQQFVYVPVLENAPSQQNSFSYSQALPLVDNNSNPPRNNFDHNKALTHSVGFDYSNAMVTLPNGEKGHSFGQGVRGNLGTTNSLQNLLSSYGLTDNGVIGENNKDVGTMKDVTVEYVDIEDNSQLPVTTLSTADHGQLYQPSNQPNLMFELPKKTLGLAAELPKGFNFGSIPILSPQSLGQNSITSQTGSSGFNYAPSFAGFGQNFVQPSNAPKLQLPVSQINIHGGLGGKNIFKPQNILNLPVMGDSGSGFNGGQLNSNFLYGQQGLQGLQGFPGPQPGRVTLTQGMFNGVGLPIGGLMQAGVSFGNSKPPPMNMFSGRPMGGISYGGFGGRGVPTSRFPPNFHQGRGLFGQQGGRLQNQAMFQQYLMGQPMGQPMGGHAMPGRPLQFPVQQPTMQTMGSPVMLSFNTLPHRHAVQKAISNSQKFQHTLRPNNFQVGASSQVRPMTSLQHQNPGNGMFYRERMPLKPRENKQPIQVEKENQQKKDMEKQRNELAKYNSMLSVTLFKPKGQGKTQQIFKSEEKVGHFPVTSSFTLDLKPPMPNS